MEKLLLNGVNTFGSVVNTYTVKEFSFILIVVALFIIICMIINWFIRIIKGLEKLAQKEEREARLKKNSSSIPIDNLPEIIGLKDTTIVIKNKKAPTTSTLGYHSAVVNTADNSIAEYEGLSCVISNTGIESLAIAADKSSKCIASNTGFKSVSECKGNFSIAANVGEYSVARSSEQYSAAINNAEYSIAVSTGDYSVAVATSEKSFAKVEGKDSIAIVCGTRGRANGKVGCWLILTERGEFNGRSYPLKDIKAIKVDGKKIKETKWYRLINGEIIEDGDIEEKIEP
jgi:hypothetical protein